MLEMKNPKKVVVEGEKGRFFNSMPSKKDLAAMSKYEELYMIIPMGVIGLIFIVAIFTPVFWGDPILNILFFICLMLLFLELIGLFFGFLIRIDRWKDKRKKEKGKKDEIKLFDYVKVFRSVMIFYSYFIFNERKNIVMMKDVKAVHFDAPEFLERKGVKMPVSYRPFRQKAPNALKYPGSFYSNLVPMDHLVRIEMKNPVEIKSWNPKAGKLSMKMFHEDTFRKVDNMIISVRPKDRERFKRTMERYLRP